METYRDLSARIVWLLVVKRERDDQQLTMLLIQRAILLNTAGNKIEPLATLLLKASTVTHAHLLCAGTN